MGARHVGVPDCGHALGVVDLVPVLVPGHRLAVVAATAVRRVPFRYPLTEILCATWAVLLVRHVGIGWDTLLLAIWGFLLIALMWIDSGLQLLPDALTFPGTLPPFGGGTAGPDGARHALRGVRRRQRPPVAPSRGGIAS